MLLSNEAFLPNKPGKNYHLVGLLYLWQDNWPRICICHTELKTIVNTGMQMSRSGSKKKVET